MAPKGSGVAAIAKKAGELWKSLVAKEKTQYVDLAKKAKEQHDAYLKSAAGQKAVEAYKGKVAEAVKKDKVGAKILAQEEKDKEAKAKAKEKLAAAKTKAREKLAAAKAKATAE